MPTHHISSEIYKLGIHPAFKKGIREFCFNSEYFKTDVVQKGKDVREVKAILIGNPWRLEFPLEERTKKEPFAPHLVKDAMVEDMALVSTVELLKAYCAFLEDKISSEQIIEQLFSGIGLTKLL